jgi:hypothetical protein
MNRRNRRNLRNRNSESQSATPIVSSSTSTVVESEPVEGIVNTTLSRSQRRRRNRRKNKLSGLQSIAPSTAKRSAVEVGTQMIQKFSSPSTQFWLGVAIAGVFGLSNAYFYTGILAGSFSLIFPIAVFGGLAITFVTTYFEVGPVLRKRSAVSALSQLFKAASMPSKLPTVSNRAHHNPRELTDNYRMARKRYESNAMTMRWMAIGIEVLLGILFLGSVGVGMNALLKLVWFVASIFGTEHGLVMSITAGEMELPSVVQKQLNAELSKNQRLELS